MAIKKGVEPGMVLYKFYGRMNYDQIDKHYVYVLHSRRARSYGAYVPKHIAPFFMALDIRYGGTYYDGNGPYGENMNYFIGVRIKQVTAQEYERTVIDPFVQACYNRFMRNEGMMALLKRPAGMLSVEPIRKIRIIPEAIETDKWPEEEPDRFTNRQAMYTGNTWYTPTWG